MNFCESQTKVNLSRAYMGEVSDGARYQWIAKDAKAQGYGFISNTLKMLAKNEMAHARVFYDLILCEGKSNCECSDCGCKNLTLEAGYPFVNYLIPDALKIASQIEQEESIEIYKEFETTAIDEGFKDVANAFHHVIQAENCHHLLLKELYEKMSSKKLYKMSKINKWKCSNCGTELELKEAPQECPLCKYPQGYFMVPLADQ